MYEIGEFVNRKRNFSTAIIRTPEGSKIPFTIAGKVPMTVCNVTRQTLSGTMHNAWYESEEDAKQALINCGIPFFQLPGGAWYPRKPETDADFQALETFWTK